MNTNTSAMDKVTSRLPTAVGLILALVAPLLYNLLIGPFFLQPTMMPETYLLIGQAVMWALTFSIFAITRFGEHKSLTSLGVKRLSRRLVAAAVGLGILLAIAVPLLTLLTSQFFPTAETGRVIDVGTSYPAWIMLLVVLTAGITEEVLYRPGNIVLSKAIDEA